MTKSYSLSQLMQRQTSVPTKLLTDFSTLGLNELDLALILHMHTFLQQGNDFPTPGEIASLLTITEADTTQHIRKLMQKDMLEIKELSVDNKWTEAYSLEPLWEKLFAEKQPQTNDKAEEHEGTIFILFEQEFARPLSPFEIETINIWLDEENMKTELIKAALRESVLMGKLNFKYIDRILREWKHKGIHSVDEAREHSKAFRNGQEKKQYHTEKRDTSVYFNWIKGEE
ncbi:MAG TPA: DnaD domain-containing protein [Pseudogracilibacillus sp.]|nr:DnaD domain-containing protein [Pseudogracilibacillus sp.]